jgi:hypothetical protein
MALFTYEYMRHCADHSHSTDRQDIDLSELS